MCTYVCDCVSVCLNVGARVGASAWHRAVAGDGGACDRSAMHRLQFAVVGSVVMGRVVARARPLPIDGRAQSSTSNSNRPCRLMPKTWPCWRSCSSAWLACARATRTCCRWVGGPALDRSPRIHVWQPSYNRLARMFDSISTIDIRHSAASCCTHARQPSYNQLALTASMILQPNSL